MVLLRHRAVFQGLHGLANNLAFTKRDMEGAMLLISKRRAWPICKDQQAQATMCPYREYKKGE